MAGWVEQAIWKCLFIHWETFWSVTKELLGVFLNSIYQSGGREKKDFLFELTQIWHVLWRTLLLVSPTSQTFALCDFSQMALLRSVTQPAFCLVSSIDFSLNRNKVPRVSCRCHYQPKVVQCFGNFTPSSFLVCETALQSNRNYVCTLQTGS